MSEKSGLSLLEKMSFGAGGIGWNLLQMTVVSWIIFYYTSGGDLPLLISPVVAGGAMLGGRIIDAIADPAIGHWSDVVRTRWGRRIPFLVFGTPALILTFLFMWYPPIASQSIWNFVYLLTLLSSFWFFFTVYVNPYIALLPQIVGDDAERVDLGIYFTVGMGVGIGAATVGVPFLIEQFGYKLMAIIVSGIVIIPLLMPSIGLSEDKKRKKGESGEAKGLVFKDALKETLQSKSFQIFLPTVFLIYASWNTLLTVLPFIVTVLVQGSEGMVSTVMLAALPSALVALVTVQKLSRSWGKKKLFLIGLGLTAVVSLLFSIIGLLPFIPPLYLAMIAAGIFGFPVVIFFTVENAVLGEIVDEDEKETGYRREGMFSGIRGLATKAGIGFAVFSSTALMEYFGYTVDNPLGIRLVGVLLAILAIIGIFIFRKFPLEE